MITTTPLNASFQIPRSALIWILMSVVLVIAPQSLRMPIWVTAIAALCVTWRILIYLGKVDYPGRLMRVLAVITIVVLSLLQLGRVGAGLDIAASLLALGFVLKLIEMREKRDIYVVISLSFIMTLVSFIYSQSVLTATYIFFSIIVVIGAMVSLNRSILFDDARGTINMTCKIALQAIPLTIVLFLVFPRIAPLWSVPMPSTSQQTGVSDEMSPGDISQLGRSSDLAFRVSFSSDQPPLHESLYWRGLVLDKFDGSTWTRSRSSAFVSNYDPANPDMSWEDAASATGIPSYYTVTLEPTQQPWLYGLHLSQPLTTGVYNSRKFELFNFSLVNQRISYDMRVFPDYVTDLRLSDRVREVNLALPEAGNNKARLFARELRDSASTDREYINKVLANFSNDEFFYTLNPALLGNDRIDDFLFVSKEGFCEHYASTFAFLMRAVGLPTRVVVGYQGAEYNFFENYMMVYQYNAHAWNEVWLEGEGWVRFDPTSAVSPERIIQGVEQALRDDPAFREESIFSGMSFLGTDWFNNIRLRLDALEYEWNRRVVNYSEETQYEIFEKILGEVTERKILFLLVGLAALAVGFIALTVIKITPDKKHDQISKLYLAICKDLDRVGLCRNKGEGPTDFCQRVALARPDLAEEMQALTAMFVLLKYSEPTANKTQLNDYARLFRKRWNEFKPKLHQSDSEVRQTV